MSDPTTPKVQVTFAISATTLVLLDGLARNERRSRSDMVRIAVDEFMERHKAPPIDDETPGPHGTWTGDAA